MANLRMLFDVGVGRHAEAAAPAHGCDVATVRDRDPSLADDAILRWAVAEGRIVVTMDQDFGALVFREGLPRPVGVLLLRLEDAAGAEKGAALTGILTQYGEQLLGNFAVFQRGRLRLRPLQPRWQSG